jgi:hypothetical protein
MFGQVKNGCLEKKNREREERTHRLLAGVMSLAIKFSFQGTFFIFGRVKKFSQCDKILLLV